MKIPLIAGWIESIKMNIPSQEDSFRLEVDVFLNVLGLVKKKLDLDIQELSFIQKANELVEFINTEKFDLSKLVPALDYLGITAGYSREKQKKNLFNAAISKILLGQGKFDTVEIVTAAASSTPKPISTLYTDVIPSVTVKTGICSPIIPGNSSYGFAAKAGKPIT